MLECDESEAGVQLAALQELVRSLAGSAHVTEVTSTCIAVAVDATPAGIGRLKGALKLAGATIMTGPGAGEHPVCVILSIRPPHQQDPLA